jgi:hypothetical protein
MSRAININAAQDHVVETCARRKLSISAIETLLPAGTRVVMSNAADAATIAAAYGSKVLRGAVKRRPTRLMRY